MTRPLALSLLAALVLVSLAMPAAPAQAQDAGDNVVHDGESLRWSRLRGGVRFLSLYGDRDKAGQEFAFRLEMHSGFEASPHIHPVAEHMTVLSGRFFVGVGESMDKEAAKAYVPGSYIAIAPGRSRPHVGRRGHRRPDPRRGTVQDRGGWDAGRRGALSRAIRRLPATGALLLAACIPGEPPTLRSGDPAPDFTAASLHDGSPVSLSDYRGHALLVNLWATWCHPCREETPYLQSLYARYRDDGLRVLGVSVDRGADLDLVAEFVEEFGVEYDIALDPEAVSREVFRARGLPTSVVFERDGTVAFSWVGPIPEGDSTFLEGVEAVLGG